MIRFVLRRVAISVLLLLIASVVIFVILRVIPGDPTAARASRPGFTAAQMEEVRHQLGLDQSIVSQYFTWIGGVVHGDFGQSYFSEFSTTELISERVGASFELAIAGTLIGLLIAIPAGVLISLRPHGWVDRVFTGGAAAGMAVPPFCLGILLVSLFAVEFGWFPTRGYVSLFSEPIENLRFLALPAITVGLLVAAPVLRFLRAAMLDVTRSDYVRTAEGKGLLWRQAVIKHVLPNAMLPTLTFVGLVVGSLLGGIVIVEYVFGWPGLGALAVDSVGKRDYAVLQGVVLFATAAFIVTSLVIDLLCFAIDPRLRARGGS
ncbi:MAG: ABC transporter permease [Solirubrobacterales bacterium]